MTDRDIKRKIDLINRLLAMSELPEENRRDLEAVQQRLASRTFADDSQAAQAA
jgi:hypothetical protein